ncbi:MAG: hypothetical protein ACREMA_04585 [Longimicrobiales bacterium]
MGYHRSPDRINAAHAWRQFLERNAHVISAVGLPASVTATIDSWDEFLQHGFIRDDPIAFTAEQLSEAQYSALVEFANNYFAAGYEFYSPIALRSADQMALRTRFDDAH